MKKIVVFGSSGMLGNYVYSLLSKSKEVIPLTRKDYDLVKLTSQSLDLFLESLNLEQDSIIINCAGVIPQTKNENIREYIKVNSLFPVILSMICNQKKWRFIHITTDCVFSGNKGNYDENSEHDETNIYGVTKSLGEIGYGTIIRTSIIGEELNNKRSLFEWVKLNKNGEIDGYTNHFWNGVTCLQLAKIINQMIEEDIFWDGVRHIFSPDSLSKYKLVKLINDIYALNININPVAKNYCDKTMKTNGVKFLLPDLENQILEMKNSSTTIFV